MHEMDGHKHRVSHLPTLLQPIMPSFPSTCATSSYTSAVMVAIVSVFVLLDSVRHLVLRLVSEIVSLATPHPMAQAAMLTSIVVERQAVSARPNAKDALHVQVDSPALQHCNSQPSPLHSDTDCSSDTAEWDWVDDCADVHPTPDEQVVPYKASHRLIVADFLCPCGECPLYLDIEDRVHKCCLPPSAKNAVCRILQAYSTYNEAYGFHASMIRLAHKSVLRSGDDEDAAFEAFVRLVEV